MRILAGFRQILALGVEGDPGVIDHAVKEGVGLAARMYVIDGAP